jgi:uncharacterized membrane protein YqiK
VIARFGKVENLVTQVLEPTIGNYFRNAAQGSDVIEFLKERQKRQNDAKTQIAQALEEYNVNAVDTLIGDITPPDALMKTLTDRKIAQQEKITYETQKTAEETRKDLQEATAKADIQKLIVEAQRDVEIAELTAKSVVNRAKGEADAKTINAKADAEVLETVGNAQATKTLAVGKAEAEVIKQKTEAVGQTNYTTIEVGQALAKSGFKLVPDVVAGGASDSAGGVVNAFLGNMLHSAMNGNGHKPILPESDNGPAVPPTN